MSESINLESSQPELQEPKRHYLNFENFKLDWSMLLPDAEEEENVIDWNKLMYGEDQCLEFDLKKNERLMRPESYDYMFRRASDRTDMEKFFLKQSGFCAYDNDSEEELEEEKKEELKIKRFVIDNSLRND